MRKGLSSKEQGSALLAVLVLVFTGGLITALMMAIGSSGSFEVASHVEQQRSMFVAEGVAQRVQWLISADRYLHGSETLGETDYEEYEYERFIADSTPHVIDYYGRQVKVVIEDARQGRRMDGTQYRRSLDSLKVGMGDDEDFTELVNNLKDKITDYIDSNDDVSNEGLEESDYEGLDMKPLPRNGTIQFREELLYIPGFRELMPVDKDGILSSVRLIPPENTVTISGNPSLLTATKQEIMNYCNIDDEDELEAIMEAIREWKTEKVPLSDGSLDPLLLGRLNNMPRTESGIYTVRITADAGDPRPFKRLIFSFQASPVAGPSDKIIQYLQWMFY
ncbi:MAG: general secretion pathway protein GspK [Lentisphaeria bacterium]|nr:general secretion pathway protein GspK [Lentisphaeria bacterium]